MEYQVVFIGQGAGYNMHDKIKVENSTVEDIAKEINQKANLQWCDLGLVKGNLDEMIFGRKMDGMIFNTPILAVRRISDT